MTKTQNDSIAQHLKEKVDTTTRKIKLIRWRVTKSGCWNCISHSKNKGYAQICIKGKIFLLHRHVYEQMFGIEDHSLFVLHNCDNPACINPEHLRLGTQQDNMRDRSERGRVPRGTECHLHKLKIRQVIGIKKLLKKGVKRKAIMEKYSVNKYIIFNIEHGRTWKWLRIN